MPGSTSLSLLLVGLRAVEAVDRDAVAGLEETKEEGEEPGRRSVWEETGQVRVVECCGRLVGNRTGMEKNSLHRATVGLAEGTTTLRIKTARLCMECSVW